MRVCVPLLTDVAGANGASDLPLAAHFGLAKGFAVIDSASGDILGECRIAGHCPGACHCPLPNLLDCPVDALAGPAMGFRLLQISRRAGLPALAVKARTLGELRHEIGQKLPVRSLAAVCLTNTRCQPVRAKG